MQIRTTISIRLSCSVCCLFDRYLTHIYGRTKTPEGLSPSEVNTHGLYYTYLVVVHQGKPDTDIREAD